MRADLQRAASGMPVAAPTRVDVYAPRTRMMGQDAMMGAGATTAIPPVDYDDYDGRYPARRGGGGGGHRWIPWVVGLLVVLGVVGGAAYYLLGSSNGVAIPLVQGESQAQAEQQITQAGLRYQVNHEASSSVQAGNVISTSPTEGTNVAKNTLVTLNVSNGAPKIKVPYVVGEQGTAAASQLSGLGLTVTTATDNTSTQPQGQVISQSIPANSMVASGAKITITVSGDQVPLPSTVNDPVATAQQILQGDGFSVNVVQASGPANVANGIVFNQSPPGGQGANAAKGAQITIYVQNAAKPTAPPTTPNPTGSGTLTGSPNT